MNDYVYGRQAVRVLLSSPRKIVKLYVVDAKDALLALFQGSKGDIVVLSHQQMNERFSQANHQGVVAQIAPFSYESAAFLKALKGKKQALVVVLDGVEDPQNLGAIARSAWAAGAAALVIKEDRQAQVVPQAIRASAGYLLAIPVVRVTNIVNTLAALKKDGFWVVGAMGGAKMAYQRIDPSLSLAYVVGAEHGGISSLVQKNLDFAVSIPMANGVESLNVSAAAAVLLADLYARRVGS